MVLRWLITLESSDYTDRHCFTLLCTFPFKQPNRKDGLRSMLEDQSARSAGSDEEPDNTQLTQQPNSSDLHGSHKGAQSFQTRIETLLEGTEEPKLKTLTLTSAFTAVFADTVRPRPSLSPRCEKTSIFTWWTHSVWL